MSVNLLVSKRAVDRGRSPRPADLAEIGAMGHRSADKIDCLVSDEEIEIGAVRSEGILAMSITCIRVRIGPSALSWKADLNSSSSCS